MLEVSCLSVRYGGVEAVRDVSLTVNEGQIVAILGANGAGKSSTLHAISGATRPFAGQITFQGEPLVGLAPEKIIKRGLALVPEGRCVFERMTVQENLQLGATSRKDRAAVKRDLEAMYARFPALARYRQSNAGKLSGGEQQQLAIARALLARPRLLLLDEPSLGLAPLIVKGIFEMLVEMREEGITALLVEQYARSALRIADYVYVLAKGRVTAHGRPSDFSDFSALEKSYLGSDKKVDQ